MRLLFPVVALAAACSVSTLESSSDALSPDAGAGAQTFAAALSACVAQAFTLPALREDQRAALDGVFQGVDTHGCRSCHYARRSYGTTGNFTAIAREEFERGIALRHKTTRDIVERCVAPGAARDELLRRLVRMRTTTDADVPFTFENVARRSRGGIAYFTTGPELDMREQVVTFLAGGLEVPTQPGTWSHEAFYAWVSRGARFESRTHVEAIMEVVTAAGLDAQRGDRAPARVAPAE